MKNFNKKLTLFVSMAIVASSVQPTWIGDKFSVISAGTKSGLAFAYSYVPAMPSVTLPTMPTMPSLTGIKSGAMNAGSAIVSGTKSSAVIAGAAIAATSKVVAQKASANKGLIAFLSGTALVTYILNRRAAALKASEVVETAPVVETLEVVTAEVVSTLELK